MSTSTVSIPTKKNTYEDMATEYDVEMANKNMGITPKGPTPNSFELYL